MSEPNGLAIIIGRARENDPAAFELLVDEYSARLYGFLYRMTGDLSEAEDLVQEVFVRVVSTLSEYKEEGRFEAWIFQIARNLGRDRARRIRRSPAKTQLDTGNGECRDRLPADPSADRPDHASETADEVEKLQACLARLADEEREVVMLRHYSSLTFSEIAQAMGTPLGTALARAHRGLAKLRTWMEPPA